MSKLEQRVSQKKVDKQVALVRKHVSQEKLEEWNKGKAKSFEEFVHELSEGEMEIVQAADGTIQRWVKRVKVYVFYQDQLVVETVQRYTADGDSRNQIRDNRPRNHPYISEKRKPHESPRHAARRGIEEELGLKVKKSRLLRAGKPETEPIKPSSTYPAVYDVFRKTRIFYVVLRPGEYQLIRNGHTEVQEGKKEVDFEMRTISAKKVRK